MSCSPEPFTIFTGDTKTAHLRVVNVGCDSDPLDLTDCTAIDVALPNADGTFSHLTLADEDVVVIEPKVLGKFDVTVLAEVSELLRTGELQNFDVTFTIGGDETTVRFYQALSVYQRA